jgi:GAF domain-containing protein
MNDTPNDGKLADLSAELESARRYAHAAMAETEALRKTIVTLADDSRMDYLLDRLLGYIHDVVPFDSACVLFTEQEGSPRLFLARESPLSAARTVVTVAIDENPFIQQMVVERKSVLLGDLEKETSWRSIKPVRNARCWIGVPLAMHDCVLGVLSIVSRTPDFFAREHFRLAKLLAIPMTVSIHRAQLYEWAAIYSAERRDLLRRVQAGSIGRAEKNTRETAIPKTSQ